MVGFNRQRLEQLLAKGATEQRPRLGLQISDAARTGQPGAGTSGAYVGRVAPGSPGERAGLRQGDIINELNSRPIHSAHDLEDALSILPPGSRAVIGLLRSQQTLRIELVLQP
ncbi:MAG: PDZ domain-containing protein [Dehalococcoidia bacterium]|nr:PDZ domain-containing protein [Dehalococcoidia bacterium]